MTNTDPLITNPAVAGHVAPQPATPGQTATPPHDIPGQTPGHGVGQPVGHGATLPDIGTATHSDTVGHVAPTPIETPLNINPDTVGQRPGHGATPSDTPTQTPPAMAGHVAPQPGMTGSKPTQTPGQTATQSPVSGYVTLDEVMVMFEKAGVVRARRTFQRYCETGMLQGQKFDTLNGLQYFVLESSVPRAIESVRAMELSRTQRDTPGQSPDQTTVAAQPAAPTPAPTPQAPAPAATLPSTHLDPAMARYVERLEHDLDRAEAENDNKTDIINSLIERDRETNSLTQGLQKLLTPLLGRVYGQDFLGLDQKNPPNGEK